MTQNIIKTHRKLIPKDHHLVLSVFCVVVLGVMDQSKFDAVIVLMMDPIFATIMPVFV